MFTYELTVRHQPSGEEMNLQLTNLPNVEPLLREVRDELLRQGVSQSDLSQYIPPLFYAHEVFVPNLSAESPCEQDINLNSLAPVQHAVAPGMGESSVGEVSLEPGPGKASCDVCGAIISTSNMARHKQIHSTALLPFACGSPCKKRALRREQILSHQKTSACPKYLYISYWYLSDAFLCLLQVQRFSVCPVQWARSWQHGSAPQEQMPRCLPLPLLSCFICKAARIERTPLWGNNFCGWVVPLYPLLAHQGLIYWLNYWHYIYK